MTVDVISVDPETPGIDGMLEKFSKEHAHSEDEVRFTIKGPASFTSTPKTDPSLPFRLSREI